MEGKQFSNDGSRIYEVNLDPKKSGGRVVYVTKATHKLVKVLMQYRSHNKEDIIFERGENLSNPYKMWTDKVSTC